MTTSILHPDLRGHFLGVGSLVEEKEHEALEYIRDIQLPYTYQRPARQEEDMIRQFGVLVEGFEENGTFILDVDLDAFRHMLSDAEGLLPPKQNFESLVTVKEQGPYEFLKTQVTAPATMCYSIRGEDGRQLLTPQMFKFFSTLTQRIMQGYLGYFEDDVAQLVICQDDPSFGFVAEAIDVGNVPGLTAKHIMDVTESLFPNNVIPAYHYCYDWRVLKENGRHLIWQGKPKIAHLDMIMYPPDVDAEQAELINTFLLKGGAIALGVLPNIDSAYDRPVLEYFKESLHRTLSTLSNSGVSLEILEESMMVSTQCGLSGASPQLAREIHENDKKYPLIVRETFQSFR